MLNRFILSLVMAASVAAQAQTPSASSRALSPAQEMTNLVLTLAPTVLGLQEQVQRTLAGIALFNLRVAEARAQGAPFLDELASLPTPRNPASGQNFGTNFGANYSARQGTVTGRNFSVAPGSAAANLAAATAPPGSLTTVTNQVPAPLPITSQTARAMIVLQNDLERMLPVLNTLNGTQPAAVTQDTGTLAPRPGIDGRAGVPLTPTGR